MLKMATETDNKVRKTLNRTCRLTLAFVADRKKTNEKHKKHAQCYVKISTTLTKLRQSLLTYLHRMKVKIDNNDGALECNR